jgi:hypothetical protein
MAPGIDPDYSNSWLPPTKTRPSRGRNARADSWYQAINGFLPESVAALAERCGFGQFT